VFFDRGDYGDAITVQTLKDFHRERVKILVDAGADLIAFETIPNKLDAQVTITFANLIKFHFDFEYAH
jgi:S-methylmethionine-dependent homocysteine/selenocysteine methylase